jgi:hypothetical protein
VNGVGVLGGGDLFGMVARDVIQFGVKRHRYLIFHDGSEPLDLARRLTALDELPSDGIERRRHPSPEPSFKYIPARQGRPIEDGFIIRILRQLLDLRNEVGEDTRYEALEKPINDGFEHQFGP